MIIYKITNRINEKVYIGKTTKTLEERIIGHYDQFKYARKRTINYVIYKAMRKYGWENFVFEIIDNALTEDVLNEKEMYWIKYYNCKIPNGYNMTNGGEGCSGMVHSLETKFKISAKKKEMHLEPWNKGKSGVYTVDTKTNISKTLIASHVKNGITKIVVNETTGEEFSGTREAAEKYKVSPSAISRACNKVPGKSKVKGCYWRYKDDTESIYGEIKKERKSNVAGLVANNHTRRVRNITTGEEFESLSAAGKAYGVAPSSISKGCKKGYLIKGCRWEDIK